MKDSGGAVLAPVPPAHAYRLLNHGPVTLVSSAHQGRRNVMAAAWAMPLDFNPPKVAVVIDKSTFTRELVAASAEFALNLPTVEMARETHAAGSMSGRDGDKFDLLGLATFAATRIAVPLIAGCVAWLECRVIPEAPIADRHDLFLAEVVAASADSRAFRDGRWHFDDENLRTLHHVAGGHFFSTGRSIDA